MNINLTAPYGPLVRRIETEATVIGDQVLKIDHFLNHRIEPGFITEMGRELARRLAQFEPSVILTAEASGIAPGLVVAQALNVALVYAKKYAPQVESPAISRVIPSPTKGGETKLVLSQRYIVPRDRVVIVDDFLSNGRTAVALIEMARRPGRWCCARVSLSKSVSSRAMQPSRRWVCRWRRLRRWKPSATVAPC